MAHARGCRDESIPGVSRPCRWACGRRSRSYEEAGRESRGGIGGGSFRVPGQRGVFLSIPAPSLMGSIQMLAEHADSIADLRGLGEDVTRQLLGEIMRRSRLTYPLAKVFIDAGHDELSRWVPDPVR